LQGIGKTCDDTLSNLRHLIKKEGRGEREHEGVATPPKNLRRDVSCQDDLQVKGEEPCDNLMKGLYKCQSIQKDCWGPPSHCNEKEKLIRHSSRKQKKER